MYNRLNRDTSSMKRESDFTQEPKSGWLHQSEALEAGEEGIFYSFPLLYAGSIVIDKSLRSLNADEQTAVTRELMAIVAEEGGCRPRSDRTRLSSKLKGYVTGNVTVGMVDVSLYISASGLAIAPPGYGFNGFHKRQNNEGLIEYHHMRNISLAAGGEMRDYDLVSYVAKDDIGKRECYVFDCGPSSDEVLTTIGQAFNLAQKRKQPKQASQAVEKLYERADEYLAINDPIYDQAGRGNKSNGGYTDMYAELDAIQYDEFKGDKNPYQELPGATVAGTDNPMYAGHDQYLDVNQQDGGQYLDVNRQNEDQYLDVNQQDGGQYLDVGKAGARAKKQQGNPGYLDVKPDDDQYLDVSQARGRQAKKAGDPGYLDVKPDDADGGMYLDVNSPLYDNNLAGQPGRVAQNQHYLDSDGLYIDEKHLRVVQGLNKYDNQRRKAYDQAGPSIDNRPQFVFIDDPSKQPKMSIEELRKKMGKK